MPDAKKMEEIINRHAHALSEELTAVFGDQVGFIISSALITSPDNLNIQHAGNMDKQVACDIFAGFIQSNDDEVNSFRSSGARPN